MLLQFQSLHLSPLCSSSAHPRRLLRFRPSRRQHILYLRNLGIDSSTDAVDQILRVVDRLKDRGFSDQDFPRIAFLCPKIFSPSAAVDDARSVDLLFAFLAADLSASPEQARDLVSRCPELLAANVEFRLRPTTEFLKGLGVRNLNTPTTLNAHLLNTPIERLVSTVRFLEGLGFSYDESAGICARFPAIFGYSVENNLRPKVEYLVGEMGRPVEELRRFPQYFGFSLDKRIAPRHQHLRERSVRVGLQKMLLLSDERFYAKWK